jgi:hypothetical protein
LTRLENKSFSSLSIVEVTPDVRLLTREVKSVPNPAVIRDQNSDAVSEVNTEDPVPNDPIPVPVGTEIAGIDIDGSVVGMEIEEIALPILAVSDVATDCNPDNIPNGSKGSKLARNPSPVATGLAVVEAVWMDVNVEFAGEISIRPVPMLDVLN